MLWRMESEGQPPEEHTHTTLPGRDRRDGWTTSVFRRELWVGKRGVQPLRVVEHVGERPVEVGAVRVAGGLFES